MRRQWPLFFMLFCERLMWLHLPHSRAYGATGPHWHCNHFKLRVGLEAQSMDLNLLGNIAV